MLYLVVIGKGMGIKMLGENRPLVYCYWLQKAYKQICCRMTTSTSTYTFNCIGAIAKAYKTTAKKKIEIQSMLDLAK